MNVRCRPWPLVLLACAPALARPAGPAFERTVIDAKPPDNPWIKIAGDLNGDGKPDIIIGGAKGPLVWYRNPDWKKFPIAAGGYNTVAGAAVDIDRDGDLDIALGGVVWFENPGPKADPTQDPWPAHEVDKRRGHDLLATDLDGDGKVDLIMRDQSAFGAKSGHSIFLYRQITPAQWTMRELRCGEGEGISIGDVNRDRRPDIIIGGSWLENSGDLLKGPWTEHVFTTEWNYPHTKIGVGDLNGDGRIDIVLAPAELQGGKHRIAWCEAPADPKAGEWKEHVIEQPVETVIHGLAVADFDRDGKLDLAAAHMHQGKAPQEVVVYLNAGDGLKWKRLVISNTGSHDIVAADIDGDGRPDILGANHGGAFQPVELWRNVTQPAPAAASVSVGTRTLPRVKVSDNGRFLVTEDGRPFFWLGDTSWGMLSRCVREDAKNQPSILGYFRNRQAKNFNVLQAVLINSPAVANAYRHRPFIEGDFTRPLLAEGPDNDYWDMADWFIDQAAAHGMYLALLPIWADSFDNNQPVARDPKVAYRYGQFIGSRYRNRTHIIWVLGGDPIPDRDVANPLRLASIRAMAEGIADGVNGFDAFDGQADYSTSLMTYHPRGGGQSSSKVLHKEPWLDFNMIQTTTRFAFSNYDTVSADYQKTPAKPTLDAEVAYEGSLSLNGKEPQDRRISPWHVRLAAYWNVFAGGFGHTYGHRSFISFVRDGEKLRWGAEIPWHKSLDAPGSFQMTHLRNLMESRPVLSRIPDQSIIAGDAGKGFDHGQATRDRDGAYAMIYLPRGKPVTVNMDKISGGKARAWWFDPRQGKSSQVGEFDAAGTRRFDPPSSGEENDWVLVLDDATKQFPAPGSR